MLSIIITKNNKNKNSGKGPLYEEVCFFKIQMKAQTFTTQVKLTLKFRKQHP